MGFMNVQEDGEWCVFSVRVVCGDACENCVRFMWWGNASLCVQHRERGVLIRRALGIMEGWILGRFYESWDFARGETIG